MRDVLGKSEPITYLSAFDGARRVQAIEILSYRESHGGEVGREAFRRQFVGKDREAKLALGGDIRNVSGATISCRAITDAVHDDLLLLDAAVRSTPTLVESRAPESRPTTGDAEIRRARVCMGTSLEISVADVAPEIADPAIEAAFAEGARLDGLLSHYRDDSDISRLNRAAGGERIAVSSETLEVLAESIRLARATQGAFDPCLGAACDLWTAAARSQQWPDEVEIGRAREISGVRYLELSPAESTARLAKAGVRLDLGGIGKGYALDRMGAVLRRNGVACALLNFGGQILALDPPRGTEGWNVDVAASWDRRVVVARLRIARASVATSSDAERGGTIGTRPVSHIVVPSTALPASATASVTIYARSALDADAWSTAAFVLGPDAERLTEDQGIGAFWIQTDRRLLSNSVYASIACDAGGDRAPER
ncbi:MAG: FAD:protein FMN transferase [Planctomycetes bacterium]|nr:FAD:protein FMN transferase [Planctomycetota bacterium]